MWQWKGCNQCKDCVCEHMSFHNKKYLYFFQFTKNLGWIKDDFYFRFIEALKRFCGAWIVLIVFTKLDAYYKCDDLLKASFLVRDLIILFVV